MKLVENVQLISFFRWVFSVESQPALLLFLAPVWNIFQYVHGLLWSWPLFSLSLSLSLFPAKKRGSFIKTLIKISGKFKKNLVHFPERFGLVEPPIDFRTKRLLVGIAKNVLTKRLLVGIAKHTVLSGAEERGVDGPSLDRSYFSRLQPISFLFCNPSSSHEG